MNRSELTTLYFLRVAGLALLYALLAKVVLDFFAANHVVSIVWPPSGLALAALLMGGKKYWPGIFIGAFLANVFTATPYWVSLGIATGNTLEAVTATWVLQRFFTINIRLVTPRDFLLMATIGAIAALISAGIGVSLLCYSGFIPDSEFGINFLQWWQGDVLGMDLIAPLILIWRTVPKEISQPLMQVRLFFCFGLAFLCGQTVFQGWFNESVGQYAQDYWLFMFITWCAIRFGRHGVSLMLLMIAVQYLVGLTDVANPMPVSELQTQLTNFWFYMLVMTLVGMSLAMVLYARRQDQEKFRESEERWKFALDGSGAGVWDWAIDEDKVYLSPLFQAMYGFDKKHVEANPRAWSALVHPQDMPQVLVDFDEHLAGKTSSYRNEHRVRCHDGSYKWILDRGMVVRHDVAGKPLRMVGTHTDITERKQSEKTLLELNNNLEERVSERTAALEVAMQQAESATHAKSEFVANMSHEIRTPISSILGMSHLALKTDLSEKQRDYIEKISLSGEHLLSLIDNILDFSKIEAGKITLDNRHFLFDTVADTLRMMFDEKAQNKGLSLLIDAREVDGQRYYGDPLRIAQILINYVNNAIKFSESGSIIVSAKIIESGIDDDLLKIDVIDNGMGLTDMEKQSLFRSFQQADTSITRRYGGTGLGLAICKQLADMMGGHVGAESELGQGSRFWLTLRLKKTDKDYDTDSVDTRGDGATLLDRSRALQGKRILLVEDNLFNQQVACELLEAAGAFVVAIDNGNDALARLRAESFDCVLMDMQMPVMDGLETTRQLRADPLLKSTLVIAMTANAWSEDRERCLAAGMNDFLSKPVRPSELLSMLGHWFNGSRHELSFQPSHSDTNTVPELREASVEAEDVLIDLTMMRESFPDDNHIVAMIVGKFIDMTTADVSAMQLSFNSNDLETLQHLGHKLKSSARQLGAMQFANICEAMEHAESLAVAGELLQQLQRLLPDVVTQLKSAIG